MSVTPFLSAPARDNVAAALAAHPFVAAAALQPLQLADDAVGPDAAVVPSAAADDPLIRSNFLDSWRAVFEDTHGTVRAAGGIRTDAAFLGWDDSFSGEAIPLAQMHEWVHTAVDRILALRPRRVLELGAGTGLLLRSLLDRAPIELYAATDFSEPVIAMLSRLAGERATGSTPSPVITAQADALQAVAVLRSHAPEADRFDTVVVNSVAQYFPSLRYLESVILQALQTVSPGGHLFLGDLRSDALHEAFCALRTDLRYPRASGTETAETLAEALENDGELSIDPAWAHRLLRTFDQITAVEVAPRRGESFNEMTLFRFDLVLHVGCDVGPEVTDWRPAPELSATSLDRRLATEREAFGYRSVGNARLTKALESRDRHGLRPGEEPAAAGPPFEPEQLCLIAEQRGWRPRLSWSAGHTDGRFDISFLPQDARYHCLHADPMTRVGPPCRPGDRAWAMFAPRIAAAVTERIRQDLRGSLPSGLTDAIPDRLVFVGELPLPGEGFPRRPGLTGRPSGTASGVEAGAVPEGPSLALVLDGFRRHLKNPLVEQDDNFFAAGGESLTAAMCVRDLKGFGADVGLRDLFECQTARALAGRLDGRAGRR